MLKEGVIQFRADHTYRDLEEDKFEPMVDRLTGWRTLLFRLELLGQDHLFGWKQHERYEGVGFGNMSLRIDSNPSAMGARPFLITGTQTGRPTRLYLKDYCVVTEVNIANNRCKSYGPVLPSSESMTHASIYRLDPQIRVIFHVHSPEIFRAADRLNIPSTAQEITYGTPDMAREMKRLYQKTDLAQKNILVMKGHEDGVIAFGKDAKTVGGTLLHHFACALS